VQDLCTGRYSPESQPAETTLTVTESIVHLYCAHTEHQRHITQQPPVFPVSTRRLQPKCFQLTMNSSGHRPTAESHTFAAHKPAINCPMSLPSTALNSQHPLHNAKFTKLPQALQPKQVCVQPLHMLTKWHCPHRPEPTAANLPLRHAARRPYDETDVQTDIRQLHSTCLLCADSNVWHASQEEPVNNITTMQNSSSNTQPPSDGHYTCTGQTVLASTSS